MSTEKATHSRDWRMVPSCVRCRGCSLWGEEWLQSEMKSGCWVRCRVGPCWAVEWMESEVLIIMLVFSPETHALINIWIRWIWCNLEPMRRLGTAVTLGWSSGALNSSYRSVATAARSMPLPASLWWTLPPHVRDHLGRGCCYSVPCLVWIHLSI